MNGTMLLKVLLLGENHLYGEISDCWTKWPYLQFIKLDGNSCTGSLPSSLGTLQFLGSLHLQKNRVWVVLPPSLQNCTDFVSLDLSENELNGHIPTWLSLSLQNLMILNLRSNKFHGLIPNGLCSVRHLQVLDLSHNNHSGSLPKCIDNFSSMARPDGLIINYTLFGYTSVELFDNAFLVMKGALVECDRTLGLVKRIDLCGNGLSGEIPRGLTRLQVCTGAMGSLESMDFSENQLSGSIPHSISNLIF